MNKPLAYCLFIISCFALVWSIFTLWQDIKVKWEGQEVTATIIGKSQVPGTKVVYSFIKVAAGNKMYRLPVNKDDYEDYYEGQQITIIQHKDLDKAWTKKSDNLLASIVMVFLVTLTTLWSWRKIRSLANANTTK